MASHERPNINTFTKCEDTTLPAGNPVTAPSKYGGIPAPLVPALALLSAWLAGLGRDACDPR